MTTKPSTTPATAKIDPVAVTKAILEETPELANPLIARKAVEQAGDGSINISGTTETIHNIGDYILSYTPAANAYINALVNRIGFVIISSKMYTNPWADFKKGRLEYGETVEEIFVNLCRPYQFSPSKAEQDVFKRTIPDVRAAFHTMNFQKYYPITISDDQLRQAFLSWQGITDLIAAIVEMVYASASTDEFLMMKYMLARCIVNGDIQGVQIPAANKANAVDVATAFRQMARTLTYQSDKYSISGVTTHTNIEDQYLIITAEFEAVMDLNVLAAAYNLDYADFIGRVIGVDSFIDMDWKRLQDLFTDETGAVDPSFHQWTDEEIAILQGVPAVMTARNFWQIWDNFEKMTENYNGKGLYWNYNYHVWKTFSISPFAQAIAYSDVAAGITSVTVTPTTATLPKGADLVLTATVAGTGVVNKGVTWSLTGNASSGTYVSASGKVHVAKDETAATLTVKATSIADATKSATSIITVAADAS